MRKTTKSTMWAVQNIGLLVEHIYPLSLHNNGWKGHPTLYHNPSDAKQDCLLSGDKVVEVEVTIKIVQA